MQKSVVFLYTNNEVIPFTIALERIKYVGIKLRKQKTSTWKTINDSFDSDQKITDQINKDDINRLMDWKK